MSRARETDSRPRSGRSVPHSCHSCGSWFRVFALPKLRIGFASVVILSTTWAMAQNGLPEGGAGRAPSPPTPLPQGEREDAPPAASDEKPALPNSTITDPLLRLPPATVAEPLPQAPADAEEAGVPPNTFGHLGISVVPNANDDGLTVVGIERTSPAYPAGLIIGDQIVAIGGQRISKFADLVKGLRTAAQGDGNVNLLVRRRGTVDTINVMVGGKKAQVERPRLGVTVDDSNGQLRVTGLTPKSPAAAAGVQVGDEIVTVNDYPVSTYDLFVGQIQAMGRVGGQVPLGIRRNGKMLTLRATIGDGKIPPLPKGELPPVVPSEVK
jgi:membrane-associated protease RseP (regulator of RpoE activity)